MRRVSKRKRTTPKLPCLTTRFIHKRDTRLLFIDFNENFLNHVLISQNNYLFSLCGALFLYVYIHFLIIFSSSCRTDTLVTGFHRVFLFRMLIFPSGSLDYTLFYRFSQLWIVKLEIFLLNLKKLLGAVTEKTVLVEVNIYYETKSLFHGMSNKLLRYEMCSDGLREWREVMWFEKFVVIPVSYNLSSARGKYFKIWMKNVFYHLYSFKSFPFL